MKKILVYVLIILAVVALFWILSASRNCSQTASIWETRGICLASRSLAVVCPIGVEVIFGILGGMTAKAKNYPYIMGFLLGFFLSFMGALIVLTLSPRPQKTKLLKKKRK